MTSTAKVILVTGANQGIGLGLVRLLAEKGHIVYIGSRKESAGKEAQAKLAADGFKTVKFVQLDVTSSASILAARDAIQAAEGKLDVLVNNAGIAVGLGSDGSYDPWGTLQKETATSVDLDSLRQVINTNIIGAIETTNAFAPLLEKASSGTPVVLNVSSNLGSNKAQADGQFDGYLCVAYSLSKAALNSYTIGLANSKKKDGWKVNVATPGYTATNLNNFTGTDTVEQAALSLLPWTLVDSEGPTGKFFGQDGNDHPW